MKKVLIYGMNPFSFTGNGNMMNSILSQLDKTKFSATGLVVGDADPALYDPYKVMPVSLKEVQRTSTDQWGLNYILRALNSVPTDIFLTVGIDLWRFLPALDNITKLLKSKRIPWVCIAPYDSEQLNEEWVALFNVVDFPCVYSKFGYNKLKDHVKNLRYFRPNLFGGPLFQKLPDDFDNVFKNTHFKNTSKNTFMYGFIGENQVRKEPHKVIKAYASVQRKIKNEKKIGLYMHTDQGVYNIKDLAIKWGVKGPIGLKHPGVKYPVNDMVLLYNALDCVVLPSVQEGLSWTILEAMLCKTPIIASNTTAHRELLGEESLIPCKEMVMIPMDTNNGRSHVDGLGCKVSDITKYMTRFTRVDLTNIVERNHRIATNWLNDVSNVNYVLQDVIETKETVRIDKAKKNGRVLFIQHSAAGDVFMTTRCFKGLKERHPDMPLDFMTQKQFINIVENNPNIDKIIEWDDRKARDYSIVYNPHGEKILPGHWGRNSNSILSDFYWKILQVKPDDFFINELIPKKEIKDKIKSTTKPICVVHTTGGDSHFRNYKYMGDICHAIRHDYTTIQIGGKDDVPAGAEIDLRGKLNYQESAYVAGYAEIAVTVDSFVSHLMGAYGVSQVCLFGSGNAHVCRPAQEKGILICRTPDYCTMCKGLGPCSANVKDCPATCTGLHDPEDILKDIRILENNKGTDYNEIVVSEIN